MNQQIFKIAGYNDCSLNRSAIMRDSELQTFSVFAERPRPEFIDSWRQHIDDTGEPETFSDVSNSKPERSANVVLLSEEIVVRTSIRPGGQRVPCPLCSPSSPKFGKGRMAYFPDDGAARFIGHNCAKRYLGSNYTEAERLFRIEAKCAEYLKIWPELQRMVPRVTVVVQKLYGVAVQLSKLRSYINVQAPGFSSFLYNDLVSRGSRIVTSKDVGAKSHPVRGLEFLAPDFDPERFAEKLMDICHDIRRPLPSWAIADGDNDASKEIIRRGRAADRRLSEMSNFRDLLDESARFLNTTNLRLLEQWRVAGFSPFTTLSFKRDGDRIDALSESFAGRSNWSIIIPPRLMNDLPGKEALASLDLTEITN